MSAITLDKSELFYGSIAELTRQGVPPSTFATGRHEDAEAAIALVAKAGQALRQIEIDSRDAVTRATNAALEVKERLEQTISRAEQAEAALKKAEAEISELSGLVEQADDELANLRSQLRAMEQKQVEMTERAESAERRAAEANTSIERIVTAMRTEFLAAAHVTDQRNYDPGVRNDA